MILNIPIQYTEYITNCLYIILIYCISIAGFTENILYIIMAVHSLCEKGSVFIRFSGESMM